MEALPQISQTLREVDRRIPGALRTAFGIRSRSRDRADVASFAASLLKQCARKDGGGEPMECDGAAPRALRMDAASCYLPDHDEDAHFCLPESGVVGVADGVGGYRADGVDAAAFSRGLMMSAFAEAASAAPGTRVCPYALLDRAYELTAASGAPGASTAVVLSLVGEELRWALVGDSGFAVFRGGRLVLRSRPQLQGFNCPFQLRAAAGGHTVADAAVGRFRPKEGDVVVVGSDGLFDNVFDAELQTIVRMGTALGFSPKNMADVIAGCAYEMARSKRESPFSTASREQQGTTFSCGKPDDITVVVAFIVA